MKSRKNKALLQFKEFPQSLVESFDKLGPGKWLYRTENIIFFEMSSENEIHSFLNLISEVKADKKMGIISKVISSDLKNRLKEKEISYLSIKDELYLVTKKAIIIHQYKNKNSKLEFPYTTLISPNGLEILDVIIRSKREELNKMNGVAFCQRYQLNSSKLSQIMKVTESSWLVDLKIWLSKQSLEWWIEAFSKPRTRKGLTPFDTFQKYVFRLDTDKEEFYKKMKLNSEWNDKFSHSGIELLKEDGLLRDKNIYLCVEKDFEMKFLKEFSLIPAGHNGQNGGICITSLKKTLKDEVFFSKYFNSKNEYNILRMMWGIQSLDDRIQEARKDYLRRFLNENK